MMFVSPSRRQQAVALLAVSALCIGVAVQSGSARELPGEVKQGGKDEAPFQGNWNVIKVTKDGAPIPDEFLKEVKVNFTGVKLSMSIQDLEKKGTVKIDTTKKPPHIDLQFEGGDENGYGIFEFDGDTVKIYAAEKKEDRPKDFKGEAPLVIVLKKLAADKGGKTDKKRSREGDNGGMTLTALQGKTVKHPLQGTWKIASGINSGKDLPPELVGKITATFDGDMVILSMEKNGNLDSKKGTFKVDDKAKPHQIDMTENGKTAPGIYEINGDTLKLCMGEADKPRPKEFKGEAGSDHTNMVFKREKTGKQPQTVLTVVAPADQAKPAGKSDNDLAEGLWQVVTAAKDGMKMPADEVGKMRLSVKGNTVSLSVDGEAMQEHATMKLDASKKPKQIDITPGGAGDKLEGIYELTADTFKICAGKGGPRPTEFKSDAGSNLVLFELKRVVEKKAGKLEVSQAPTAQSPITGVWKLLEARGDGEDARPEFVSQVQLTFDTDGTLLVEGVPSGGKGTYKIDDAAGPGQITLVLAEKQQAIPGIYKIDGNKMVLCFPGPSGSSDRPKDFNADKGTNNVLFVLEQTQTGQQMVQARIARQESAGRAQSANNLRQIGLNFHFYSDAMKGQFPAHAIYSKDGKTPLLSWRVALLQFMDEGLFKQFKLDEPWDSEHNFKLIDRIPRVYIPVKNKGSEGLTYYQVFTGKDSVFDGPKQIKLAAGFRDGTSNTVLVVEAKDPVIWTKPDDLVLPEMGGKMPELGGMFTTGMNMLFADSAVRWVRRDIDAVTLRALITPAGGEVVDFNSLDPAQKDAMKKTEVPAKSVEKKVDKAG